MSKIKIKNHDQDSLSFIIHGKIYTVGVDSCGIDGDQK